MKVAICISGGFRNCKQLFPNFKKFLLENDQYEADIFFSSWLQAIPNFKQNIHDDVNIEEALELYKPKNFNYVEYNDEKRAFLYKYSGMQKFHEYVKQNPLPKKIGGRWDKHGICPLCKHNGEYGGKCRTCGGQNIHNHLGMLYNVYCADFLRRQWESIYKEKYDLVIRTRFDNVYFEKLSPSILDTAKSAWVIPEGFDDFEEYGGGCNDQFMISSGDLMTPYGDIFFTLEEMIYELYHSPGGYGIPHKSIDWQAQKREIIIARMKFDYGIHRWAKENRGFK